MLAEPVMQKALKPTVACGCNLKQYAYDETTGRFVPLLASESSDSSCIAFVCTSRKPLCIARPGSEGLQRHSRFVPKLFTVIHASEGKTKAVSECYTSFIVEGKDLGLCLLSPPLPTVLCESCRPTAVRPPHCSGATLRFPI